MTCRTLPVQILEPPQRLRHIGGGKWLREAAKFADDASKRTWLLYMRVWRLRRKYNHTHIHVHIKASITRRKSAPFSMYSSKICKCRSVRMAST